MCYVSCDSRAALRLMNICSHKGIRTWCERDVKKNRKDEMFLAITESKKVVTGEGEDLQVSFEKHKIFLYREDFEKFMNGLNEAIDFINRKEMLEVISDMNAEADENAEAELDAIAEMNTKGMELDGEIKIDIDFEEPTL